MKSINIKRLYKLHTWTGIITGIILFVIAFTGAVAVFAGHELRIWANPEIRSPISADPDKYQQLIAQYAEKVEPIYHEEVHFVLPETRTNDSFRVIFEGHTEKPDGGEDHKGVVYEFDIQTMQAGAPEDMDEYFDKHQYDVPRFIAGFHADLHLGRPIGLILTGLLGLTLTVSIITGILVHRKILSQLFTFRPGRSFSLWLNDSHKVMGIWGVLFHTIIAFTGTFLGLATVILLPAAAYVGFQGDQDKLIETFTAIKPPIIAHVERPTLISNILKDSAQRRPELKLTDFSVYGYGDKNAVVYVYGSGGAKFGRQSLIYNGATAEFVRSEASFGRLEGISGNILDAMYPLHYGNFGGLFVKVLWAWLGLTTALLPISGIMLWVTRGLNAQNPAHSRRTYEGVTRALIGCCGGVMLATAVLFPGQLLFNVISSATDHTRTIFSLFFSVWIAAILIGFTLKKSWSIAILGYATALCLIATMPLDALLTGSHLLNMYENQHFVSVGVDVTLFVMGIGLFVLMVKNARKTAVTQLNDDTDNSQTAMSNS